MFIKDWVRTSLIWVGLILFWLLDAGVVGHGEYTRDVEQEYYVYTYTYQYILNYGWFLYILAAALTLTACYIWTRLKNRHWAFLFWGLLSPIGLLGISLLKDKSTKGESDIVKEIG